MAVKLRTRAEATYHKYNLGKSNGYSYVGTINHDKEAHHVGGLVQTRHGLVSADSYSYPKMKCGSTSLEFIHNGTVHCYYDERFRLARSLTMLARRFVIAIVNGEHL